MAYIDITVTGFIKNLFVSFSLQAFSTIGPLVLTVQRMVVDLIQFLFMFSLFIFPFIYVMYDIIKRGRLPEAYANNSMVQTYFPNLATAHYSMFTAMFNMVQFNSLEVEENISLYILHLLFVITVVILLMNLIIAVFSNSVADVMSNKEVLMVVHTIGLCWYTELRFKMFLPWLYRRMKDRAFIKRDGKIVYRVASVNCSNKD